MNGQALTNDMLHAMHRTASIQPALPRTLIVRTIMNPFIMEMDAKQRYEDFLREADRHRLVKRLMAQRRAPASAHKLSLGSILRRFIAGGRLLKSQA